jgi:hypothetical protein
LPLLQLTQNIRTSSAFFGRSKAKPHIEGLHVFATKHGAIQKEPRHLPHTNLPLTLVVQKGEEAKPHVEGIQDFSTKVRQDFQKNRALAQTISCNRAVLEKHQKAKHITSVYVIPQ